MDEIDKKIIEILSNNGRASLKEIAEQVHLSIPAVKNRLTKLEESNVITGYTVILNDELLEDNIVCYCLIDLKDEKEKNFLHFIQNHKNILECHRLAGNYQYVLKISVNSTQILEDLLVDLREEGGIRKTITFPVLSTIKKSFS